MLGFVRRNTRRIKNVSVRRSIYFTLVRSHLGYATQVWALNRSNWFARWNGYKDMLIQSNLLPLTEWHEYLDMVFFFKAVTGRVEVNPTVTPLKRASIRTTRYTSNPNITLFLIRSCKSTTFQRSFF